MDKPRIEDVLCDELRRVTGADWVREYKPCIYREWKIDVSLPEIKLSVEIEGRMHSWAKQHIVDCEKQNYLVAHGWRCLRYPASRIHGRRIRAQIIEQIHRVMCGIADADFDHDVFTLRAA